MVQIAQVGSATQAFANSSSPTARSIALSGPLKSKMNFQMYDDGQRAEHHRHEEQHAQHVARLQAPVQAQRERQTRRCCSGSTEANARNRVLPSAPILRRILEDLDEVVEADPREVADARPVGEGEEPADRCRDVVDRDDEEDPGKRPPPVPELQQAGPRVAVAPSGRRRPPLLREDDRAPSRDSTVPVMMSSCSSRHRATECDRPGDDPPGGHVVTDPRRCPCRRAPGRSSSVRSEDPGRRPASAS